MKRREMIKLLGRGVGGFSLAQLMGCQGPFNPSDGNDPNTKKQFKLFVEYKRIDVKIPGYLWGTPWSRVYQQQTKMGEINSSAFVRSDDYNFSGNLSSMLWENIGYLSYKIFVSDAARYDGQDPTSGLVATIVVLSTVDWETGQVYDKKEIPLNAIRTNDIQELIDGNPGNGKMAEFWITHEGLIVFEK